MNILTPPAHLPPGSADLAILKLLARICEELDLPEERFLEATNRYETIGKLLLDPKNPLSKYQPLIYVQGSTRTETANRPVTGDEFDIDLICELRNLGGKTVEEAFCEVRDAILADQTYKSMLTEKKRCLRITYANLFHLDITPAQSDRGAGPENILVTDRPTKHWKASNPKDFADWFDAIASIPPRIRTATRASADFEVYLEAKGSVEPIDAPRRMRSILKRIVQLFKRHRDIMYVKDAKNAPISAIITTITAHAYAEAAQREHETMLDLIIAIARVLDRQLGPPVATVEAMPIFSVPNPRNPQENFADKWPRYPQRQREFFRWTQALVAYFETLRNLQNMGIDATYKYLATGFGDDLVKRSMMASAQTIKSAVANKAVGITTTGAVVSAAAARVVAAPNTNHGRV